MRSTSRRLGAPSGRSERSSTLAGTASKRSWSELARRDCLHDLEASLEGRAARVEVGFEEELGQSRFSVAADIVADLFEAAEERAAILPLRARVELERSPRDDLERARIAARLLGGGLDVGHERCHLLQGNIAAIEAVVCDGAPDDGGPVAADGDGRMRHLHGTRLDVGPRHAIELARELHGILAPDGSEAAEELVASPAARGVGHAHRVELVHGPAEAQADVETSPRDDVEGGELLG